MIRRTNVQDLFIKTDLRKKFNNYKSVDKLDTGKPDIFRINNVNNENYINELQDLQVKYSKLQLHYSICQVLLKVGLELNQQLQEVIRIITEKFNLIQGNIYLLSESETELVCYASFNFLKDYFEDKRTWEIPLSQNIPVTLSFKEKRVIVTEIDSEFLNYCFPITHHQKIYGVIELYKDNINKITQEEIITIKTVAAQLSSYIEEYKNYQLTQQMAITDGLTRLYNHRYFQQRFEEEIKLAHKNKYPLSLLLIDIDDFKKFNDLHGHLYGDRILQIVSKTIKRSVRNHDIVGRYGGEEFAVLISNTKQEDTKIIADRICKSVASESINGKFNTPVSVTVSIGMVTIDHPEIYQREEMIEKADLALYLAKEKGKNQVQIYHKELLNNNEYHNNVNHPINWANYIRKGIDSIKNIWKEMIKNYGEKDLESSYPVVLNIIPIIINDLTEQIETGKEFDTNTSYKDIEKDSFYYSIKKEIVKFLSDKMSLMNFEVSIMLLQDSIQRYICSSQFPEAECALIMGATDQVFQKLYLVITNIFGVH